MSWQQENYDRAMEMMEDSPMSCIESRKQQCPMCGEWYSISHSNDPEEFDYEAQFEHEFFCVSLLEAGLEGDNDG